MNILRSQLRPALPPDPTATTEFDAAEALISFLTTKREHDPAALRDLRQQAESIAAGKRALAISGSQARAQIERSRDAARNFVSHQYHTDLCR